MHSDQKKHLVLLEFPYIIKINKKRLANKKFKYIRWDLGSRMHKDRIKRKFLDKFNTSR